MWFETENQNFGFDMKLTITDEYDVNNYRWVKKDYCPKEESNGYK